jgi:hypothetical protein
MTLIPRLSASLKMCHLVFLGFAQLACAKGATSSNHAQPAQLAASCVSESPLAAHSDGLENIARRGKASQSSTGHWRWDATPDLAIDGNQNGDYFAGHSVSHTLDDAAGPWWQVDLGTEYTLKKIVIWNRTDGGTGTRLSNFKVWISRADGSTVFETTLCANGQSFSPAMTLMLPAGTRGQVVHVRLNGRNYLQLAEVEVFAPSSG